MHANLYSIKKIIRLADKKPISSMVRPYTSAWAKGLGLMFRVRAPKFCVLFPFPTPRKVGIHMYFVFFLLDIIWLDEQLRVVACKTLRPWTMYTPKYSATYVLELPVGVLKSKNVRIGDKLAFLH